MVPPEELEQLINLLAHPAAPRPVLSEEESQGHLLKVWIISEMPQPLAERRQSSFQPIVVQSKPLAETIIEERR